MALTFFVLWIAYTNQWGPNEIYTTHSPYVILYHSKETCEADELKFLIRAWESRRDDWTINIRTYCKEMEIARSYTVKEKRP